MAAGGGAGLVTLTFVTGNAKKLEEVRAILGHTIPFHSLKLDRLNNLLMAYEDKSAYAMCVFSLALGPTMETITFMGSTPMDSKASQVAAVSQTPAQLVAANSGTSMHKRKRTVVLVGDQNFEWRKWKALVAAISGTSGHKRTRKERNIEYWRKWKARHSLPLKPRERKEAFVKSENYRDGTPIQWLFLIVLNDDLCFENEEAARVYSNDFLKKVFGSHVRTVGCYHDFFNAFVVGLTKAEAATLEVRDDVEYVRNLDYFVSNPRSATKPSVLLDANKDLVENSNSGKEEKCKAKMDSKDEEPGLLLEAKENKDLAENSCPGKEEKYKTKMVTEDDKPQPLLRSKLFLVGLNGLPFEGEDENELDEYLEYMDADVLQLLCHKRFVKQVFGRRLASELKMVRSYSKYLNAFVVEVKDTVALTWRERFTQLKTVAFVRDLKRK